MNDIPVGAKMDSQELDTRGLLQRRAERLAGASAREDERWVWLAEFPLGEDRFALPLESLRAALPLRLVTPVPLSPPHLVGIVRYEGVVLSVLSLAALLGSHGWRQDPTVLLVLERGPGELVAIDSEQVPRPIGVPASQVAAARSRQSAAVIEVIVDRIEGTQGDAARRVIQLIDPIRLFAAVPEAGGPRER